MKRVMVLSVMVNVLMILPVQESKAQIPIMEIIRQAVIKVIVATDLQIQRMQNETIWLQNAQKTLENKMQELKLGEIADWVEKQRKLYENYYEELWKVKYALTYYHKVKEIIQNQVQLVEEYKKALSLFKQDLNFTAGEIAHMEKIYASILNNSIKNLDQLFLVINSFATQMTDAKRLEGIHAAGNNIEQNLAHLKQFNQQNIRLSLSRAKDQMEIDVVKALYGIR